MFTPATGEKTYFKRQMTFTQHGPDGPAYSERITDTSLVVSDSRQALRGGDTRRKMHQAGSVLTVL